MMAAGPLLFLHRSRSCSTCASSPPLRTWSSPPSASSPLPLPIHLHSLLWFSLLTLLTHIHYSLPCSICCRLPSWGLPPQAPRPHRSSPGTVLYRPWHCRGALTGGSCYVVNAGDLGGAATITFFDWAVTNSKPPPSFHTCNIVIRALGSNQFFDFLDEALQIMRRNIFLDLTTLEIIVDSLVAARHVSRAVEVLSTDQFGFF